MDTSSYSFDAEMGWCVDMGDGTRRSVVDHPIAGVALLECSTEQVRQVFGEKKAAANGTVDFPHGEVVVFTLRHLSSYWVERALDWIEADPELLQPQMGTLCELLDGMMRDRKRPQMLRHRIQRLLHSLEVRRSSKGSR